MTVDSSPRTRYAWLGPVAALSLVTVVLAGCSTGTYTAPTSGAAPLATPSSSSPQSTAVPSTPNAGKRLPGTVQALVALPTGHVLAATSDGLYDVAPDASNARVGTTQTDLTSLARDSDGTLYASGHDNATTGSAALGLLRSSDNGSTWTVVTGQGRLDLHALAVRGSTLVGRSDDRLIVSQDGGTRWQPAATVAADSLTLDTSTLWVTSIGGLARSDDDGAQLRHVADAPTLRWGALATDRTVWGIDTTGRIWRREGPDTWSRVSHVPVDGVTAFTALDAHHAVVATGTTLTWIADSSQASTADTA